MRWGCSRRLKAAGPSPFACGWQPVWRSPWALHLRGRRSHIANSNESVVKLSELEKLYTYNGLWGSFG